MGDAWGLSIYGEGIFFEELAIVDARYGILFPSHIVVHVSKIISQAKSQPYWSFNYRFALYEPL